MDNQQALESSEESSADIKTLRQVSELLSTIEGKLQDVATINPTVNNELHELRVGIQQCIKAVNNQRLRFSWMLYTFVYRIAEMNKAFQPITQHNTKLTDLGHKRIQEFVSIIKKEVDEMYEAIPTYPALPSPGVLAPTDFTKVADCLGDLIVFAFSEAGRWGIPILEVLHIIMDSQSSKLVDGKPIPHPTEAGKFGKGPNYFPPEDAIRELLEHYK